MTDTFHHRQIALNNTDIHLVEGGQPGTPPILFLHGYPESWIAFTDTMLRLKEKYHVMAIDLPGIGLSRGDVPGDKTSLAALIDSLLEQLQLAPVTIVGHDVGGMIAYSVLRHFPRHITRAVVIGTAIPGVDPWEEVKRNPYIWHFAFYSIPHLPETLATGRTRPLFDYFFDTLCYNKNAIVESSRDHYVKAYNQPGSLTVAFNWYRAFPQDERDNNGLPPATIPLLYIRGEKDTGRIEDYAAGLRKNGVCNLSTALISRSGHFVPEENPVELAQAIDQFMG
ncbi:alpha/beta fold hydrolase [Puia sp. P3]|uniref:alpha/beta fold hydrolase n=1 Tax=Puia sp. P3 TaxID=3423952 RepID=UPI003D66D3E6